MNLSRRAFLGSLPAIAVVPSFGDPPVRPGRWTAAPAPRIPVAGSPAIRTDRTVALIGGFTDRLEATAGIQVRDPRRGWLPVGNSLLEARAEARAIALDDDRILVIGGWSGKLPNQRSWSTTAEICEPLRPDRRLQTSPPFGDQARPLDGVAVAGVEGGRVVAVLEDQVSIFDPTTNRWSNHACLASRRRGAGVTSLGPGDREDLLDVLLVAGGHDADNAAIETVELPRSGPPRARAWSNVDLPAVRDARLVRTSATRAVLAGGIIGKRSTPRTWLLDPRAESIRTGPLLPDPGGIVGATVLRRGRRILLLGGEARTPQGPRPVQGVVIDPDAERVLLLPKAPRPSVRASIIELPEGCLVMGGYRFDGTAPRGSRTTVLATADLLTIPSITVAD